MALQKYGVFVGTVKDKLDSAAAKQKNPAGSPHYQILMQADDTQYRIAVNVKSDQNPPDLQFYLDDNYQHPILRHLKELHPGFTKLASQPNTAALDFIRGNLFDIHQMRIVPAIDTTSSNDLNDIFDLHIHQAINTNGALLYAFGSQWGPEKNKPDVYFDFEPGFGVHDIHMNQGNKGSHAKDNGIYQDGGLFIFYPDEQRWVAMFLKFQSQFIHTNDGTADPIAEPVDNGPLPEEDTAIRIIAALVNPAGDDPGKESVYLLNITDHDIDVSGWKIADKLKKTDTIADTILHAGEVLIITLSGHGAQLSNDGGIISVLNATGIKIHGVSYTKTDTGKQGYVIAF